MVGVNIGNVLWEFQDDVGIFVGFEIDFVVVVVECLGVKVDMVNIFFNGLFLVVQLGWIDIVMFLIIIIDEWLKFVIFVQFYYDSDQLLMILVEGGLKLLDEMKGKVVGVDIGLIGDMWVSEKQQEYGFVEIWCYEGLVFVMLDLMVGWIDGYILDILVLQYYVKDKLNFVVVECIFIGEKYLMMFVKDVELVMKVNVVLDDLKIEGVLVQLYEKWFGVVFDVGLLMVIVLLMLLLN